MLVDRRREMIVIGGGGDLSLMNPLGGNLPSRETANCYVVKEPGTYWFPIVYGCGIINDAVNSASYTQISGDYTSPFYNAINSAITTPFIETDIRSSITSAEVVQIDTIGFDITNLSITNGTVANQSCKFVQFDVITIPSGGANAIIAVKVGSNIVWSWHIWGYPFDLSALPHVNTNGYTYNFLNVNLGFVKNSATSKYGSSPYYQWGRKDPFLRSGATSGTFTSSFGHSYEEYGQPVREPTTFYKGNPRYIYFNGNWIDKNYIFNYWDASQTNSGATDKTIVKTVYDPCPVKFTIPCGNSFLGFTKNNGGTYDSGYTWDGNYFQELGYRDAYNKGTIY